jgi:energy-coupling factor transporter ATP-binding protein EcfA2
MKLALLLNVIDPKIGGVMIMGDRGTGKSTTIRALADLLPEIETVADDPFNRSPQDQDVHAERGQFGVIAAREARDGYAAREEFAHDGAAQEAAAKSSSDAGPQAGSPLRFPDASTP